MPGRKYGAAILVGGYVAKQLVWELAMSTIKEVNDKRHEEAAAHLEKVGARLICALFVLVDFGWFAPGRTADRVMTVSRVPDQAYEDGRRLAAMRRQQLLRQLEERDAASVSHHTRAK